jgi:hypothetical protein
MTNNFIHGVLKSGVRFLAKHEIQKTFQWLNTLDFWDTYGSVKFSLTDGIWKSENRGYGYSVGGIQQTLPSFKKISFSYKTSTEACCDHLRVYINGVEKLRVGGEKGWTSFSYEAPEPIKNCLVQIYYYKDGSVANGTDTVQFKDLQIDMTKARNPSVDGWSLFHQFASSNNSVEYPGLKSLNNVVENINSPADLDAAGISHSIPTINTSNYMLVENYMQAYYSSSPQGYIEMDLPDGYREVMVEYGNWYTGRVYLYIGGAQKEVLGSQHGPAIYKGSYSRGDKLRIQEDGIFWIKSIWVR